MARRLIILALSLLAVSRADAASFFPQADGTTWEYRQTGAESDRLVVRITGRETLNGTEMLKVETTAGDEVVKTDFMTADDRGLLCHQRRSGDGAPVVFDPPRVLVSLPLRVGRTWEFEDDVGSGVIRQPLKIVAEEVVVVPAGTFRAYHLHCEQPWPMSTALDRWFAPGTGFVKEIITTRGPG